MVEVQEGTVWKAISRLFDPLAFPGDLAQLRQGLRLPFEQAPF